MIRVDHESEADVVNVTFIPHKGKHNLWINGKEWGADLMLKNIMKEIGPEFKITPKYGFYDADFKGADIVHLHNLAHTALKRRRFFGWSSKMKELVNRQDRPLYIGGIRGFNGFKGAKRFIKYFDAIHVSNKSLLENVARYNPNVFLLYPGVDLTEFRPIPELRPHHFTIGWAGDSKKPMKNFHLLPKLGYSYKVATKFNYVPNREMPFFYNSLSSYVYFSDHEGCNRTIIEAAACGLPIVSTDAGAVREILDPEWIVEGNPESSVKKFSEKLQTLKEDHELRLKVGNRNREQIQRWGWGRIATELMDIWNMMMEGL